MNIFKDLAEGGTSGLLSGIGTLAKDIRQAITGEISPEKQAEIQQKIMDLEAAAMNAQALINLEEAKSASLFVSGWRPAVGWICAVSLAYVSVIEPFARFIAKVAFDYLGEFPAVDTTITLQILLAMLGVAGLRSWDKKNGVARK